MFFPEMSLCQYYQPRWYWSPKVNFPDCTIFIRALQTGFLAEEKQFLKSKPLILAIS